MHALIKTKDGSFTLYNAFLDETYHSINGAMTESMHVFIKNGLLFQPVKKNEINILEIGFGTGLNALLTVQHKPIDKTIYYVATEPFPLSLDESLAYFNQFETIPQKIKLLEKMLKDCTERFVEIEKGFYFRLIKEPIQIFSKSNSLEVFGTINRKFTGYDCVYFDAFAPQKQPDMWTLETFEGIINQMAQESLLTSYCAQGQFKRHLKSLGLKVLRIEGPPGKREMTVALM
ncbi:MAG: tRNA (5-methylaminomethyl-2-thiouridine)(34)-methyltransferase MnmD [bacterium]|nr:tRNA (5-methylaminomethyl-2-thiouridine)(34)-methyltransferase MnmD [bacterium]